MTHVEGGGVPAGTQLNGIYEIEKRVAIGGMGEVYIGRVVQTGDRVAIKMILPEHAGNQIIVDLFRREASTLHNLYHEAIVRYYVFSVDPALNRPYLAMEYAEGPSLGDRLRDGPLDEEALTVLRRRVAGGLHAAHALGVIHRDISPDNIILVDGRVEKAKIIDFGIAKSTTGEGTLIGSGFAGKLNYVSPEQLGLASGEVTAKSDIYSLGLVFAHAAIGKPLPMGGSHVDVVEKRRAVPDLSEVPAFIRPLIEAMVQPDPADRPADMQEVAQWIPPGAAVARAGAPLHPRERRRQQAGGARKGRPLLWIGLGGGAVAAAGVAAVFLLDDQVTTGTDEETTELGAPATTVGVVAPDAVVGEAYAWAMPRFDLPGRPADLSLKAHDPLPPGLTVAPNGSGTARIAGTPLEAGEFVFDILASTPSGQSAWHEVRLTVRQAERLSLNQSPSADIEGTAAQGQASTAGTPPGDAASPGAASQSAGQGEAASADPVAGEARPGVSEAEPERSQAGQGAPEPASDDTDPSEAGPTVATADPADLSAPVVGAEPGLGAAASDEAPAEAPSVRPAPPGLSQQAGAGGLPVIPLGDKDPAAGSVEPSVATVIPQSPVAPSMPSDGSAVARQDGDAPAIPKTGQPQRPSGAAPAGDTAIAAIPAPENQPPTLADALAGPVEATQGSELNVRLGAFDDEEGASALRLDVQGALPAGLGLRLAQGGIAQLHGAPAEFGTFDFRVAAVDPQGLVSRPVAVALSVAPPAENRAMRDYILGYDGGDCFLSRPLELGPQLARIEVFAAESRVQPVLDFDAAFKRDMGFEANIGMRPISDDQCRLIHSLDQVGPQALDNSLVIDLDRDELASGDALSGTIRGGAGARLYLYDHTGGVTDLSEYVQRRDGEAAFSVPITASGPQILIAARPREGAGLPPAAGLDELLAAARRGEASLALGFFLMKG